MQEVVIAALVAGCVLTLLAVLMVLAVDWWCQRRALRHAEQWWDRVRKQ